MWRMPIDRIVKQGIPKIDQIGLEHWPNHMGRSTGGCKTGLGKWLRWKRDLGSVSYGDFDASATSPEADRQKVLHCLRDKSSMAWMHWLKKLACQQQKLKIGETGTFVRWFWNQVLKAKELLAEYSYNAFGLAELNNCIKHCKRTTVSFHSDKAGFSILNDADYYSGLLFQGFIEEARETILYGGRYDRLMSRQAKSRGDRVCMKLNHVGQKVPTDNESSGYLNIALPKGRMGMPSTIYSRKLESLRKASSTIAN